MPTYQEIAKWMNDNQGVLGVTIFLTTLVFGWTSGIFSALRRRPKFKIRVLPGPNIVCTFPTGKLHANYEAHRTALSLYLSIANVGSAASSIENVSVGYHCALRPFSLQWLRYGLGWLWLRDQIAVIHDFQASIGENVKIYPFLFQASNLSAMSANTFLQPGESSNGVVYFEQSESSGGFFPACIDGHTRVKVQLRDTFGRKHTTNFLIAVVPLEQARTFNPSFGKTLAELHNQKLPHDEEAHPLA